MESILHELTHNPIYWTLHYSIKNCFAHLTPLRVVLLCVVMAMIAATVKQRVKSSLWYAGMLSLSIGLILLFTIFDRSQVIGEKIHPFDMYIRFINGEYFVFYDILYNTLFFIPLGILLLVQFSWKKSLIFVFLTSLAIETIQLFFSLGQFEICDLIDNTLGGLIGIGIVAVIRKINNRRPNK